MNSLEHTGRILHASHEGVQVLRFVGEIRHPLGPLLERFLDQLAKDKPQGLVIDLSETEIIDSTCLGLLARLALRLRNQAGCKATVVSPRADITDVLRSMSFDRLLNIVGEMPMGHLEERLLRTTSARGDDDALLVTMLRAHRTLMSLSEQNRLQFKEVVQVLERESEARREESDYRHSA
jgi:anti-anti-sigma factor